MESASLNNMGSVSGEFDRFYEHMDEQNINEQSILAPIPVSDPYLRKTLINAAEKMEEFLKNAAIDIGYRHTGVTEVGVETDYFMVSKGDGKPIVHVFKYRMNMDTWAKWLKSHAYLTEGPFTLRSRGIRLTFTGDNPEKYSKLTTSISREGSSSVGGDQFLDLLNAPPTFIVHRDYFNEKEWVVTQAG